MPTLTSRSPLRKSLAQLVERLPRVKRATLGGEPEKPFEQAFASIAFGYIKDRAPQLVDHIKGFQIVDRDDDNSKAVGVFAFKIGDLWLQVPVFFLGGRLKGHEMLYLPKQDVFVPLDENWVNHLVSKQSDRLGEGTVESLQQMGVRQPNIEFLQALPLSGKYAYDISTAGVAEPYSAGLYEVLHARPNQLMAKFAGFRVDFEGEISRSPRLWKAAKDWYYTDLVFKEALDKFYGKDFLARTGRRVRELVLQQKAGHLLDTPLQLRRQGDHLLPDQLDPRFKVKVYTRKDAALLDDEGKAKVQQDGSYIDDQRVDSEVSRAYRIENPETLTHPDETGIYDVLVQPGEMKRLLVLYAPYSNGGRKDMVVVCRPEGGSEGRGWINLHATDVLVKPRAGGELRDWLDNQSGVDSLRKNGTYVIIGPCGECSVPFQVREVLAEGRYRVRFFEDPDSRYAHRNIPPRDRVGGCGIAGFGDTSYSPWDAVLRINPRKGSKLRALDGELFVPDTCKVLTLQQPGKDEEDDCCCGPAPEGSSSQEPPLVPMSLSELHRELVLKSASLKITALPASNEYYIRRDEGRPVRLSKQAALVSLVADHGFRESAARQMLKEAATRGHVRYLVKYAQPFLTSDASLAPMPIEQAMGGPMGQLPVPTEMPLEYNQPIDALLPVGEPPVYDGAAPQDQVRAAIQQAAATGQRELFDTVSLSRLSQTMEPSRHIERFMGAWMKALDKLARALFLIYRYQEHFEDRYGKEDLPELEDSVRNAFEVLGKVVLYMKERDLEGGMTPLLGPQLDSAAEM